MVIKMKNNIRQIPYDLRNNFLPCRKCGSIPIIQDCYHDSGFGWTESFIRCPNEKCWNKINCDDKLHKMHKKWNKRNGNIFVPQSKPILIKNNCFNCNHKENCQFTFDLKNNQLKLYVCENFTQKEIKKLQNKLMFQ